MTAEIVRPRPTPLPANTVDMLAQRKRSPERTLNDHVEVLHVQLYDDPAYTGYLDAVYDEDAVEGSTSADTILAAQMIRNQAKQDNRDPYVGGKKLATIAKALNIVLRRYGMSRKERANMLHGETTSSAAD